jgi:hypothetical protein
MLIIEEAIFCFETMEEEDRLDTISLGEGSCLKLMLEAYLLWT